MKAWRISFSMKKGSFNKYRPHLKYIQKTYKPDYLTISQQKFFDLWRSKPIPVIEFIVMAHDAIHFMDDFLEKFPKQTVTGGGNPFEWTKIPKKARTPKLERYMKSKAKRQKVIADRMKKKYNKRNADFVRGKKN